MTNKLIKKVFSLLIIVTMLIGFLPIKNTSASQEYFYVNNSKVNAHTGTVLVNTRLSKHGNLVYRIGDKIQGTTYYQIASNGAMTGKPFICIEVGTQFSSYKTYGKNGSKYIRNGEYKNDKIRAFISYMNYKGMHNLPTLMQMSVWALLGQVKLDNGQANDIVSEFEKEFAKNSNSNIFKGAKLYQYQDIAHDGQRLISYDYEKIEEYDLDIQKESDQRNITDLAKSSYKLDEAKYGIFETKDNALKNTNVLAVLTTDKSGKTNKIRLKSGKYFVKEISAPLGFKLDKNVYTVDLTKDNVTLKLKDSPKYNLLNIMLKKTNDKGINLEGAEFKVNYYDGIYEDVSKLKPLKTWIFKTDKNGQFGFEEKFKIGGDELIKDAEGKSIGLIGTYEFIETKAPNGFKLNHQKVLSHVKDDGNRTYTGDEGTIYNIPKVVNERQELIINKIDYKNGLNIKDITSFKIFNNGNDVSMHLIGDNGKYIYSENKGNKSEIKTDKFGNLFIKGLPNGKYEVLETKAPHNYIKTDEKFTVVMANNDERLVISNEAKPSISTKAFDNSTLKKSHMPTELVEIRDRVEYNNLLYGKNYTIKGELIDKATGTPLQDSKGKITSQKTFIAKKEKGFIDLIFKIPANKLRGKEIVVFEELYKDEKLLTSHKDINDQNQTTKVENPSISTQFIEKTSKDKILNPIGKVDLIDIVKFNNLVVGEQYKLKLTIMDKETKKTLIVNDKKVEQEVKFTANTKSGNVEVPLQLNVSKIAGKTLIAFEELYYKDELIAFHKDINDKNQTIEISNPTLKTNAVDDISGNKEIIPEKIITIKDEISYDGLIVGKKYTIKGKLMDKENKAVIKDKNDKEIVSEITFVPKTTKGKIDLKFTVDSSLVIGKEIVVFEDLYIENTLLVSHSDINDKDQTVKIKEKEKIKETPKTIQHNNPRTGDAGIIGFVSLILMSIFMFLIIRKSKKI